MIISSLKRNHRQTETLLTVVVLALAFSSCKSDAKMTLRGDSQGMIKSLVFSPDGKTLASGETSGSVKFWDAQTGELKRKLSHENVEAIAFSPDSKTLATASGTDLKLWDAQTGELKRTMQAETDGDALPIKGLAFSQDGTLLASAGENLELWDLQAGESRRRLDGVSLAVAFSPDSKTLVVSRLDKLRLWNLLAEKSEWEVVPYGEGKHVESVVFSPDGKLIATGGVSPVGEIVKLWDSSNGTLKLSLKSSNKYEASQSVAFSPDGKLVASGNAGSNNVTIWNVQTKELLKTLNVGAWVESVAFSPDGKTLAAGTEGATIKLYDVSDLS